MKNSSRIFAALIMVIAMMLASSVTVLAESEEYTGNCSYNGKRITSSFKSSEIAKAVEDLQPGDDLTFTIDYTNDSSVSTDWYMENTIVKTLERAGAARKAVSGTGAAENGGYTYELIHYDSNNKRNVIFSNSNVGGEAKTADMQGLEQATNALEDWFYLETLEGGEQGRIVLNIAFEGETEVNDYMDTEGELSVRFAVEEASEGSGPDKTGKRVKTGDNSNLIVWTSILLISSILLFLIAFIMHRRERKGGEA